MARRPNKPSTTTLNSAPKADSPFAILRGVTTRSTAPTPAKQNQQKSSASRDKSSTRDAAEDDRNWFAQQMQGIAPVRASNRAELDIRKPAPVPIRQPTIAEPASKPLPTPAVHDDASLLRDALRDVRPLKDTGRREIDAPTPTFGKTHIAHIGKAAHSSSHPSATTAWESWEDVLSRLLEQAPHDDGSLFEFANDGTRPLKQTDRIEHDTPPPLPTPRMRTQDEQNVLHDSLHQPISFEDRLDMGVEDAFLRTGLPRRILTDLRRGRWVVQAELDFHGLNRDEARAALGTFIANSLHRGMRCVRLIHGKGLHSQGRIGVLKHLSRNWLAQREEILAFCQARPHDGGEGALLILLRAGNFANSINT